MNQQLPSDWVLVGRVTRAHGIKGAVAYKLLHVESDCLRENLEIFLSSPFVKGGLRGIFKITQLLSGHRFMLSGISDRTEAEKLAKAEIWVRRSDFPKLEPDEVYLIDLIGFEAINTKGVLIGNVTGFSDNRAQILVQIDHETLIPFVKPILVKIDEDKKQIILDDDHAS